MRKDSQKRAVNACSYLKINNFEAWIELLVTKIKKCELNKQFSKHLQTFNQQIYTTKNHRRILRKLSVNVAEKIGEIGSVKVLYKRRRGYKENLVQSAVNFCSYLDWGKLSAQTIVSLKKRK